jgi:competence protein ComEC
MPTIHFLNVKEGDCSVIQHNSGHVSVIDVCNAKQVQLILEALQGQLATTERGISGNFQQKNYPVNPISYLRGHGITNVFRYIQTHPDMDHMDGIKLFFQEFNPLNFWDTDNAREISSSSWEGSPYNEDDWSFYRRLRDTKPEQDPRRLALLSGARGKFYNIAGDGSSGGDGISILAPTQELVEASSEDDEYNRCSYVILYRTGDNRIVFGGDSHDDTWNHILEKHQGDVTNIDLLIAPHHGRKSSRSYKFLDNLMPRLTFFGNAPSEHLAYSAWSYRELPFVTNNQANCMVVDAKTTPMTLYVTHEHFARRVNANTYYSSTLKSWYVGEITRDLII